MLQIPFEIELNIPSILLSVSATPTTPILYLQLQSLSLGVTMRSGTTDAALYLSAIRIRDLMVKD